MLFVRLWESSPNVFMDNALRFRLSFQDEIKERLDETDLLVVIYSATLKPSHGYTGLELGYFIGAMERGEAIGRPRRIVPIYLDTHPTSSPETKVSTSGFHDPR